MNEPKKRGRAKTSPYPNVLICTVTKNTIHTNPVQFKALMEREGKTIEEVIATFVSREGRKIVEAKKSESTVVEGTVPHTNTIIINNDAPKTVIPDSEKFRGNICWDPVFHLDHKRFCDGCGFLNVCQADCKKVRETKLTISVVPVSLQV